MEVDGPWALQVCPRVSLWIIIYISRWILRLYSMASCVFTWLLYLPSALGSYDSLCRQMAADLDAVVVTVEWVYTFHWNGRDHSSVVLISPRWVLMLCSYRMAPDVHFPVQYDECVRAAKHFLRPEVLAKYSVRSRASGSVWRQCWRKPGRRSGSAGTLPLIYSITLIPYDVKSCHQMSFNVIFSVKEMVLPEQCYFCHYLLSDLPSGCSKPIWISFVEYKRNFKELFCTHFLCKNNEWGLDN